MNQLLRPHTFPSPQSQHTLKEMTIICHLYGGKDFILEDTVTGGRRNNGKSFAREPFSVTSWRQPQHKHGLHLQGRSWKLGGGLERDHSVLVEVELDKVTVLEIIIHLFLIKSVFH